MPLLIVRQDITKMRVDAIVNTTNENMTGFSGVDLAVHTAAGSGLDEECGKIAPLGLGEAKITGGYHLPCKYIIHTSGPVWHGGLRGERILLRSCYIESLKLAVQYKCRTLAFPLISSGYYGYPKDQVLKFAVQTIKEFLFKNELTVYLCVFDKESYSFSKELFNEIQTFIDEKYIDEYGKKYNDGFQTWMEQWLTLKKYRKAAAEKENAASGESERGKIKRTSLSEYVKQTDRSFQEMLFALIDKSGMTDVECYKRANVNKKTFSKIRSSKDYHPSKQT
ncbi:MAG: macro domain-containing protein, partial [Candidatus Scatosoma sp.]